MLPITRNVLFWSAWYLAVTVKYEQNMLFITTSRNSGFVYLEK